MPTFMKHSITGEMKSAPIGFSWTVLFFGFFVPLLRGDIKWAALMFAAAIISGGLANIAFAFAYNALYRDELVQRGFRPMQDNWGAQPQNIVQQVYVNAGNGYASVAPAPDAYDPFAARAAAAYARDPAPAEPVFHEPLAIDSRFRQPPPSGPARGGFGRKGL